MFVLNFKLNSNFLLKIFLIILLIIVLLIIGISINKLFLNHSESSNSCSNYSNNFTLSTSNYTDVLKAVHEDLNSYIGQQITFSGYIYRLYDFNESQFVLARDMIIDSNNQTLVVGFLCHCDKASSFKSSTWVEITGTIMKGDYNGEIPIIEISDIKEIKKPTDEFVYPPGESYVATSTVL